MNLDLVCRALQRKKMSVVGKFNFGVTPNDVKAERERHIAVLVVVTISLAISCNMGKLWSGWILVKHADQPVSKFTPIVQQSVECHGLGNITVVKEQDNTLSRWKIAQVWPACVNSFFSAWKSGQTQPVFDRFIGIAESTN